jgi:hypothetical protein
MNNIASKKFEISGGLISRLMSYLKSRPWQEVDNVMHELFSLKELKNLPDKKGDKDNKKNGGKK